MIAKDRVEMERGKLLKAARAAIRLKYALKADEELNEVLPGLERQFNEAVAAGESFELQVGSVFE